MPRGEPVPSFGGWFETNVAVVPGAGFFSLEGFLDRPFQPLLENNSFESPALEDGSATGSMDSWSATPGAGVRNPPGSSYDLIPQGDNLAFAGPGASLSQVLMSHLAAEHNYRLEARIGRSRDGAYPSATPPDVFFRAGGQKLVPETSSSPTPAAGEFALWRRDYRIAAGHPLVGQPVEVVLEGGSAGGSPCQVDFDLVEVFTTVAP